MEMLLSQILGIIFFPITLLGSWVVVHPQEEKLILMWGNLDRIIKKPCLMFVNLFGRKVITISTKQQTIEIPKSVVADANANPIITAAICTFEVVDSEKAALEVEEYLSFVKSQAIAVLKQVAFRRQHYNLTACTKTGIYGQRPPAAQGRLKQQVSNVSGEHINCGQVGLFLGAVFKFGLKRRTYKTLPGVIHC